VCPWILDPSCDDEPDVEAWVEEAPWLIQRARLVLSESMSLSTMPGNVKEILDAVLGTHAGTVQYQQVLGELPHPYFFVFANPLIAK
jgi:hypothetical protein